MYKVPHNIDTKGFPAWISYAFNGLMFGVIFYLKLESISSYPPTPIIFIVYFTTIIISGTISKFDKKWNYCWIFIQSSIIFISFLFIILSQDHVNLLTFAGTTILPVFIMPYIFSMRKRSRGSK